jgi:type IX secretion system PorP/SprF family membrane protein
MYAGILFAEDLLYLWRNSGKWSNNMKQIFTAIILCWGIGATAQQAPQYSLYMLNLYAYNPACAGLDNSLIATGVYRQQWSGLKGAPLSEQINAHLPLYKISSGAGLRVENDAIGAHRVTSAMVSYNYQLETGRSSMISAGLSVGYLQYTLDGNKLRAPDGTYDEPGGTFSHNDQLLPEGKISTGAPLLEAGLYFKLKKLALGLALQPVFVPVLTASNTAGFGLKSKQNWLFTAAYTLEVSESLMVMPSMLIKSDITETQSEISVLTRWRENIFAGASFRGIGNKGKDAAVLFGGLRLNEKTTLGYAFDIPLSSLRSVNRGSHELLLRYNLNKPIGTGKLPPIIYNPRFL